MAKGNLTIVCGYDSHKMTDFAKQNTNDLSHKHFDFRAVDSTLNDILPFITYSEPNYFEFPETLHHPTYQRKMVAVFTKLVNKGYDIVITTHSDYLVREINNRIKLNQDFEDKESFLEMIEIGLDEVLSPSQIKAFLIKEGVVNKIRVDHYGIYSEVFGDLFDDTNFVVDEILTRVGM